MGDTKRKLLELFRSRSTTNASPRPQDRDRDRDRDRERDKRYHRDRDPSYSPTNRDYERRGDGNGRREGEGRRERRHDNDVLELRYEKPRHEEERRREEERREGERKTPKPGSSDGQRHGSVSKADEKGRATPRARHSSAPQPSAPTRPAPLIPPLTAWPPTGYTEYESLSQGKAMEYIATGTPIFKGHRQSIPHAPEQYYYLYATYLNNNHAGTDQAHFQYSAFASCSMRLQDSDQASFPWETLEQPSMAFYYGTRPGTVTLNQWVGLSSKISPGIELRETDIRPRDVEFSTILERLIHLETNFEEDSPDVLYKSLYKNLLRDPDKYMNPHKAMEMQIADLITILSRSEWIDFSLPHNQVVAKFFSNATYTDNGNYKRFFHQLLLSMELDCRIQSKSHAEWAKEKLLGQLPPCVRWTLAVARRWREGMSIERYKTGEGSEQIRFHLKLKTQQTRALRRFAKTMNWPNLHDVTHLLSSSTTKGLSDSEPLENRSSDCLSFFTGMVLPGQTLPWLTINSLIDIDPLASSSDNLNTLSHMYPHTGFQYRSTTYWSASSIVGKVLAPTAKSMAGWIGPCRPAPDLERIQTARIRQRKPKSTTISLSDITSMTERSDPLGPPSKLYPINEYALPLPDLEPENVIDTIRIEKLALKPVLQSSVSANFLPKEDKAKGVKTYDAAVQFAVDGRSWPLRLSFDVEFVSAVPCKNGPHPLFFDYAYEEKPVDELLSVRDWGRSNRGSVGTSGVGTTTSSGADGSGVSASSAHTASKQKSGSPNPTKSPSTKAKETGTPAKEEDELDDDTEKVLLVSAFGVSDNEVLARAWCSHWGLSAIIADMERTCISCAVREAYASCINVVILVHGTSYGEEEIH